MYFSTFQKFGLQYLQKIFKQILADLFLITRKDQQTNVPNLMKGIESDGRWNDLKIDSFFSFLQNVAF